MESSSFKMLFLQFLNFSLGCLFNLMGLSSCWQYFTSITNLTIMDTNDPRHMYGEYIFGDCRRIDKILVAQDHKDHNELRGKVIIRGWLDVPRIPTCIILRGTAYEEDFFRTTAFKFQMCVPRVTFYVITERFKYYYYEWYIPSDVIGGMNWDIYFYIPANKMAL